MESYDFVIVGAGIVGLTVARELVRRGAGRILLLEKEAELGLHSSGRNSGVLHAGIYYATDSLKAKVCAEGSRRLQSYAADKGIRCTKTGKVIIAASERDLPALERLFERAQQNGIVVRKIDERELKELEPRAATTAFAIHSPETAVIDVRAVLEQLARDLEQSGVELCRSAALLGIDTERSELATSRGRFGFGHWINCAGLHADRIAHLVDVGRNYRILPFKGIYRKLRPELANDIRGSIYPAPNLAVPFLGVHITRNVFGDVYVGPTAMPAFGRENYRGGEALSFRETPAMLRDLSRMLIHDQCGFRRMVWEELRKYRAHNLLRAARALVPTLRAEDLLPSDKVGLRAQLVDERRMTLEMDFILESGPRSTHVLNAISPAFTASMALAELIVDRALVG